MGEEGGADHCFAQHDGQDQEGVRGDGGAGGRLEYRGEKHGLWKLHSFCSFLIIISVCLIHSRILTRAKNTILIFYFKLLG